ncbi:polysialyltransferase family glycosyltransferase [Vibrio parahaemolyticus]|uniref:polysialyltransferase family glycosyltransferase n=1 Tax=Vibrio parahaemolyticus TaxID=670 RepID=UPI00112330DD|nr:polysialyltransferase family glycosyltransferase [Vibrio parahaemolyticus]TOE32785.1 hypothetical protein CGJ46_12970 [Vibrio parahaemolyticus]
MSELYLIRNLLSIKTATAIINDYGIGKPIYSVVSLNGDSSRIIKKNIKDEAGEYKVCDSISLNLLPFRLSSIFKQRKNVGNLKREVRRIFEEEEVERIFITYPIHLDSYVYFSEAKKMGIEVCFFEEGPCFYRAGQTKQYEVVSLSTLIKKVYFKAVGLEYGYNFKPDKWYSSLPMEGKSLPINLVYSKVDLPQSVHNVFLSRPVSDDSTDLSIFDEVDAIMLFIQKAHLTNEDIYIKFHPRESDSKRKQLLNILKKMQVSAKCIKGTYSSEDMLFSMKKGVICGYDTTTLVYSKNINPNIKSYSVLGAIKDKDSSGFLNECYNEYCNKYPHIEMILK